MLLDYMHLPSADKCLAKAAYTNVCLAQVHISVRMRFMNKHPHPDNVHLRTNERRCVRTTTLQSTRHKNKMSAYEFYLSKYWNRHSYSRNGSLPAHLFFDLSQ